MSDVLFDVNGGKSRHDFLFFYGGCSEKPNPSAVRHGPFKAYWCTGECVRVCVLGSRKGRQGRAPRAARDWTLVGH